MVESPLRYNHENSSISLKQGIFGYPPIQLRSTRKSDAKPMQAYGMAHGKNQTALAHFPQRLRSIFINRIR